MNWLKNALTILNLFFNLNLSFKMNNSEYIFAENLMDVSLSYKEIYRLAE